MAAHAGAEFHPIPIRQSDLADHFADAACQSETLCVNAHGVAKYLLSRAVRDAGNSDWRGQTKAAAPNGAAARSFRRIGSINRPCAVGT